MLRQVLGIVLQGEVESARRCVRRAILVGAVAFLLLLAFVFVLVSLFLWLATLYEPSLAALLVVGVLLALALLVWGAGRIGGRAKARRRAESQVQAAIAAALATHKGDASLATMAAVLAVGYIVGRGISK